MKTTPTLGLKLYDPTDAPDLVSGYNASMSAIDGSGVLAFQGTVHDSTDWDTITDAGYYACNNTKFSSANHSPVDSYNYGVLIVYNRCDTPEESKCVTQFYYPHAAAFANRAPVSRAYYSNAWSAWAPVTPAMDVPDVEGALPANGAAGQVLVKSSASDYDCEWMSPTALNNVLSLDSTYGLQQGGTLAPALQVRSSNESMVAMLASTQTVQCQQERNVYGALTPSGLTMCNDGGTTSYTVGANGKGILNNITMINGDLPLKVGEEFKLKSNVIGADYKAMSAAFGFDGFNPAIGMGVLRLGSQGVQATCAVRVEASLVGSNLFTIYAVVFEPFINKHTTGFYMSGSATTTSTVDSNIDWGDSIYLTPLTKLKA